MKNNPWTNLEAPVQINDMNMKFAYRNEFLDLMWAKDSANSLIFNLQTRSEIELKQKIPKLNGIKINLGSVGQYNQLELTLTEREDEEIFHIICLDLIKSIENVRDELVAIKTILKRLEKWQYFLKNNRKIIDKKKLKGLVGELLFLNKYLLKNHKVEDALNFWRAPLQSIQDFELNNAAVEVKTKSSVNSITISSYEQLLSELDYLFLYVVTLNESTESTPESFNIYDLIDEIIEKIKEKEPEYLDLFENLLMHYGFVELDEYNEYYFLFIMDEFYTVSKDFPKIDIVPPGIEKLSYRVSLDVCKEFLTDKKLLIKAGINNE